MHSHTHLNLEITPSITQSLLIIWDTYRNVDVSIAADGVTGEEAR